MRKPRRTTGYGRSSMSQVSAVEWSTAWLSLIFGWVPYNGGEAPIDKERFVNARAEDYWTLRERFEQGEVDIDPDDDKPAAQLGSIKWGIESRGRIKIESKGEMRKRGFPSPDRADAMAMAFAGRANAAPMNVESHAGESITGDLMTKAW